MKNKCSNKELLDLILNKYIELGRTPAKREVEKHSLIINRFGSWNKAIEAAGLLANSRVSKEQVIKMLQDIFNKLGRTPKKEDIPFISIVNRHFGNLTNAIREIGLIPTINRNQEELIHILKYAIETVGYIPTPDELIDFGVTRQTFINHFGTWNKAVKKAGYIERKSPVIVNDTDEELIVAYINLSNKLEKFATRNDIDHEDWAYTTNIFLSRFKSLNALRKLIVNDKRLTISDKTIHERNEKYTDDELLSFIVVIYKEHGRLSQKELRKKLKDKKLPSINTFYRRFGVTGLVSLWDFVESKHSTPHFE